MIRYWNKKHLGFNVRRVNLDVYDHYPDMKRFTVFAVEWEPRPEMWFAPWHDTATVSVILFGIQFEMIVYFKKWSEE